MGEFGAEGENSDRKPAYFICFIFGCFVMHIKAAAACISGGYCCFLRKPLRLNISRMLTEDILTPCRLKIIKQIHSRPDGTQCYSNRAKIGIQPIKMQNIQNISILSKQFTGLLWKEYFRLHQEKKNSLRAVKIEANAILI